MDSGHRPEMEKEKERYMYRHNGSYRSGGEASVSQGSSMLEQEVEGVGEEEGGGGGEGGGSVVVLA